MIRTKQELCELEFARDLSNSGDVEQARFFNEFFKSLEINCGDEYRTQMQMSSIFLLLDNKTKERLFFISGEN